MLWHSLAQVNILSFYSLIAAWSETTCRAVPSRQRVSAGWRDYRRENSPVRSLLPQQRRSSSLGTQHPSGRGSPPESRISNAQVLNTVYEFKLPGGQNLTDAVAENSAHLSQENFCVIILETLLPASETRRYNPKTKKNASDRSCEKPFQRECLRTIGRLVKERQPAADGCRFSNVDLNEIKQCEWVFGDTTKVSTFNLLESGLDLSGGFAHITSDPYDGSNSTFLETAERRIHIVATESGPTFTLLCVKIDSKKK